MDRCEETASTPKSAQLSFLKVHRHGAGGVIGAAETTMTVTLLEDSSGQDLEFGFLWHTCIARRQYYIAVAA